MTPESTLTSSDWPAFVACVGQEYQAQQQHSVVNEMEILIRQHQGDFAEAVLLLFALHYILDLCYQLHKQHDFYIYEFIQKKLNWLPRDLTTHHNLHEQRQSLDVMVFDLAGIVKYFTLAGIAFVD